MSIGSLWEETAGPAKPRSSLPGDLTCDIAIVGAGFTGLWTAYYLLGADPSLKIVVLEAEQVGFGASGRNGGWCSALFPKAIGAMHQPMAETVDEVGRALAAEGIDADFHKGGTIVVARSESQLARMEPDTGGIALDASAAKALLNASGTLGGTFTPDCARVHPLKLARGLADAVEARGATIYEGTRVTAIEQGVARTRRGTVRATTVVRATEGYTATIEGMKRDIVPVYSLIVATEPLPQSVWDEIGLADYETFSDWRHLIVYGQRTADDRLVYGGRGAPYHFASSLSPANDREKRVFSALRKDAVDMFPVLAGHRFTHSWGGALGVPRDWMASVGLDRDIAWAGGYVGDGVSTTNLAARTLRDLILGYDTELTSLPWVNHRSPKWEPEPLRWLGVNSGLIAMSLADKEESRTRKPSRIARLMAPLVGGH